MVDSSFSRLLIRAFAENHGDLVALEDQFRRVLGIAILGSMFISFCIALGSPAILSVLAPGLEEQQLTQAASLLRLNIWAFVATAVGGVLGALLLMIGRSAFVNFAQMIRNLAIVIATLLLIFYRSENLLVIVLAGLLGWACGVMSLLFWVRRIYKFYLLPSLRPMDTNTRNLFSGGLIVSAGLLPVQIQGWFLLVMAGLLGQGTIAWLNYSMRLSNLPMALIGVALSMSMAGRFSRQHHSGDESSFSDTLDWTLLVALLLALPAATGMYQLADRLIHGIFEHGQFTSWGTVQTAIALRSQALSMPLLSFNTILMAAAFARKKHRLVVIATTAGAVLTICAAWVGAVWMERGLGAIALAALPGQCVITLVLLRQFKKDGAWSWSKKRTKTTAQIVLACFTMALFLNYLQGWFGEIRTLWALASLIISGVLVYATALLALGVRVRHFIPA